MTIKDDIKKIIDDHIAIGAYSEIIAEEIAKLFPNEDWESVAEDISAGMEKEKAEIIQKYSRKSGGKKA